MIPTVETDCRIETMLSNERNDGSLTAKYSVTAANSTSSP
jgi:hypothetical protein